MGSLGEMVCVGGMIAMVSYSSMGLLVFSINYIGTMVCYGKDR